MLCFLLFQVADGKEALYNYKFKDGMDMAWVWRYLYYKTLKMAFSYKSLFELVSFSLLPMWTMTPMLCFLLFEVEGEKEILHNHHLMDDMAMLFISRWLYYTTLKIDFSYKSILQDCGLFIYTKSEQWYQCCDFCCLKFKIELKHHLLFTCYWMAWQWH